MAKSSNRSAEQSQTAAPRSPAPAAHAPDEDAPVTRVPLQWRLVFNVWAVCFAIMVLYEVSVLIGKLFM